jgi:Winged helix-turn-helix DNA-binding
MEIPRIDEQATIATPMLEEIRRTATQRLREIEPLIDEAERLREVLAVIERRSAAERNDQRSVRDRSVGRHTQSAPRAAKGANKQLILQLIGERPGITAAQIASSTGLKRTVVASTVSRLKRYGELRDYEQGGVCLSDPTTSGGSPQHLRVDTTERAGKRARRLAQAA